MGEGTSVIQDIVFKNIDLETVEGNAVYLVGLPESPARRIRLENAEKRALLDRLVRAGLDGIECVYTTHTEEETQAFCSYARGHGLLVSGGSDFHMEDGIHAVGRPVFEPDGALLEALRPGGVEL